MAGRLAAGIGRKGFANARAVRKMHERATSVAKLRYLFSDDASDGKGKDKSRRKKQGAKAQPSIVVEDVIGAMPDRKENKELDAVLCELDALTGLERVKDKIFQLVRIAKANYKLELRGEAKNELALNRLFLGNPGCGKTSVAKIYARVLKALRFISGGEVVYKTASDFMGDVVGASAKQTRAIIEMAQGNVLIIDEAYNLDDGMYGKQALDTIVELVTGLPGEDIVVVLAGYRSPMLTMLRNQNAGLARRFHASGMCARVCVDT